MAGIFAGASRPRSERVIIERKTATKRATRPHQPADRHAHSKETTARSLVPIASVTGCRPPCSARRSVRTRKTVATAPQTVTDVTNDRFIFSYQCIDGRRGQHVRREHIRNAQDNVGIGRHPPAASSTRCGRGSCSAAVRCHQRGKSPRRWLQRAFDESSSQVANHAVPALVLAVRFSMSRPNHFPHRVEMLAPGRSAALQTVMHWCLGKPYRVSPSPPQLGQPAVWQFASEDDAEAFRAAFSGGGNRGR
jgi:hypothetical protein